MDDLTHKIFAQLDEIASPLFQATLQSADPPPARLASEALGALIELMNSADHEARLDHVFDLCQRLNLRWTTSQWLSLLAQLEHQVMSIFEATEFKNADLWAQWVEWRHRWTTTLARLIHVTEDQAPYIRSPHLSSDRAEALQRLWATRHTVYSSERVQFIDDLLKRCRGGSARSPRHMYILPPESSTGWLNLKHGLITRLQSLLKITPFICQNPQEFGPVQQIVQSLLQVDRVSALQRRTRGKYTSSVESLITALPLLRWWVGWSTLPPLYEEMSPQSLQWRVERGVSELIDYVSRSSQDEGTPNLLWIDHAEHLHPDDWAMIERVIIPEVQRTAPFRSHEELDIKLSLNAHTSWLIILHPRKIRISSAVASEDTLSLSLPSWLDEPRWVTVMTPNEIDGYEEPLRRLLNLTPQPDHGSASLDSEERQFIDTLIEDCADGSSAHGADEGDLWMYLWLLAHSGQLRSSERRWNLNLMHKLGGACQKEPLSRRCRALLTGKLLREQTSPLSFASMSDQEKLWILSGVIDDDVWGNSVDIEERVSLNIHPMLADALDHLLSVHSPSLDMPEPPAIASLSFVADSSISYEARLSAQVGRVVEVEGSSEHLRQLEKATLALSSGAHAEVESLIAPLLSTWRRGSRSWAETRKIFALSCWQEGDREESALFLSEIIEHAMNALSPNEHITIYHLYGRAQVALNDLPQGIYYLNEAWSLSQHLGDPARATLILQDLAKLSIKMGRTKQGATLFKRSLWMASHLRASRAHEQGALELADLYLQWGFFEDAESLIELYIHDLNLRQEVSKSQAEMEAASLLIERSGWRSLRGQLHLHRSEWFEATDDLSRAVTELQIFSSLPPLYEALYLQTLCSLSHTLIESALFYERQERISTSRPRTIGLLQEASSYAHLVLSHLEALPLYTLSALYALIRVEALLGHTDTLSTQAREAERIWRSYKIEMSDDISVHAAIYYALATGESFIALGDPSGLERILEEVIPYVRTIDEDSDYQLSSKDTQTSEQVVNWLFRRWTHLCSTHSHGAPHERLQ